MPATKKKTGLHIGREVSFPAADGCAVYKIVKINQRTVVLEWIQDHENNPDNYHAAGIGGSGRVDRTLVERCIGMDDLWEESGDEHEAFYEGLTIGDIVHYHDGFSQFIRCEVVASTEEKSVCGKVLKPIGLVGEWFKHQPLSRGCYHVKQVLEGKAFTPHASNVYESPGYRSANGDPTKLESIPFEFPRHSHAGFSATLFKGDDEIKITGGGKWDYQENKLILTPKLRTLFELHRNDITESNVYVDGEDKPLQL